MRVKSAILKHFYLIPSEVFENRKLSNNHRTAYAILAKLPKEKDGSRWVRMRDFAYLLNVAYNTALRVLDDLQKEKVIEIVETKEGRGGGFRIAFLNTIAVAFLLSVAGPATASHKQNYQNKSDIASSEHILYNKSAKVKINLY